MVKGQLHCFMITTQQCNAFLINLPNFYKIRQQPPTRQIIYLHLNQKNVFKLHLKNNNKTAFQQFMSKIQTKCTLHKCLNHLSSLGNELKLIR